MGNSRFTRRAFIKEAGLVAVERHPGRCPIVTLLEAAS